MVMKNPFSFRAWNRILTFLLYGGASKLRDYEKEILEKMSERFQGGNRESFRSQLRNLDHVKRLHDDRMVTFYFY